MRSITTDDIAIVVSTQHSDSHMLVTALRSLFHALRRERLVFRDPARLIHHPARSERFPTLLSSDRVEGLIDSANGTAARLVIALFAIHALYPKEVIGLTLDDIDRSRGRITIRRRGEREHILFLDELTLALMAAWLQERFERWPTSTNPHLLVSQVSAIDSRNPPISSNLFKMITRPLGVSPMMLRADRILDEARHTADPLHLMSLFGISVATAMKYLHAAHPERFIIDPTKP